LISLKSVVKTFAQKRVVDCLSFEAKPGEVIGLLGPNGAGKTTTLRMIAGLLEPTSGEISVCGHSVSRSPLEARRSIGFLTTSTALYERLTPREILKTFGALFGCTPEFIAQRTELLSAMLDLRPILDQRCGTLSSGQKQRVSIARATLHDPPVLILDEPTATLDPLASEAILALVRKAQAEAKTVLFSTHRMEEAEFLCTKVFFMVHGRIVDSGTVELLKERSHQRSLTGAFLHYARERTA
jgi:sodium transport system ATP-binding protein